MLQYKSYRNGEPGHAECRVASSHPFSSQAHSTTIEHTRGRWNLACGTTREPSWMGTTADTPHKLQAVHEGEPQARWGLCGIFELPCPCVESLSYHARHTRPSTMPKAQETKTSGLHFNSGGAFPKSWRTFPRRLPDFQDTRSLAPFLRWLRKGRGS